MRKVVGALAMVLVLTAAVVYNRRLETTKQAARHARVASVVAVVDTCTPEIAPEGQRFRFLSVAGTICGPEQIAISPKVPARILRILVSEGDSVRRGQELVLLDLGDLAAQVDAARAGVQAAEAMLRKARRGKDARTIEMEADIAQAEGNLAVARAKLRQAELGLPLVRQEARADANKASAGVKQAEAGLSQAEAGLRQAEDTVKRLEYLYAHGGVAAADLEDARTQVAIAKAGYETAKAALELARAGLAAAGGDTPERRGLVSEADVEAARAGVKLAEAALTIARKGRAEALRIADQDISAADAQLRQARAGYAQAVASVGNGRLTSPVDGVVTSLDAHAGEYAQPGFPIMRIVSRGNVHVEAQVPSASAAAVRPGQEADIAVRTDPPMILSARVSRVGAYTETGGRTVPVRLAITDRSRSPRRLRPGMGARVDIRTDARPYLLIPYSSVRYDGASPSVFVVENGKARSREVVLGRTAGSRVEVLRGVTPHDRIVVAPSLSLQDGDAVQESGQ